MRQRTAAFAGVLAVAIVTTHDPKMTAFADWTVEISDGRLRAASVRE